MISRRLALASVTVAALSLTACGSSDGDEPADNAAVVDTASPAAPTDEAAEPSGIRLVEPDEAAAIIADAPDDLVILDVRTAEEFDEGHLDGAVMIDFYRDDFADEVAKLDPDVPYVLYCRSGNRSGSAQAIMTDLGFTTVDEVNGGVLAWEAAGLPLVTD